MDLVFCGTPQFAVPTLRALVEAGHSVRLVVTQPDRPVGREQVITAPPVKQTAQQFGIPVVQPEKIKNNEEFRAQLQRIAPRTIIVVGYGRIIPKWMIDLPSLGNLNLHASLLPKYRGAAPVQWAIAMGETVTGVTTMRIDEGLDTGDILLQKETPIEPGETALTVGPRLAELGAPLMVETLAGLESGRIQPRPQDNSHASLAPILKREDGLVDFSLPAPEIVNRWRGFQPWPGAYTTFRGRNLALHGLKAIAAALAPGELRAEDQRLIAGCGRQTGIEILELQPEGKRRMSSRDFIHGYRPKSGEELGAA